ncbi:MULTISPECIES: DUF1499 domain-containing protein [Vibrio]|jgi:uncharacterized protein (DUF1499 family)|uniref:DUF1499 domain-containing protein n=1 Tax=Vibrio kanaloae TaxID=170673 RepID=A0ABV4LDM6_9VIBR|nr:MULTISPECIES: DUF1499 domain-containing protein [Vibrio]NOI99035.1 DUF1499 domain-containing protein [Vibrio kanaloae]OEF12127.1 hypothetical protein A132_01585 [Vibrio kanaloae 5S-149]
MEKTALLFLSLLTLTACSQGITDMEDRTSSPCGDKPNCVSTQDDREQHALAAFELSDSANLDAIEQVALTLPGSKTANRTENYLRIECTSRIMRFVDDLELRVTGGKLIVRSESRTGYSDFGVNRKRAEQLRTSLKSEGLIK